MFGAWLSRLLGRGRARSFPPAWEAWLGGWAPFQALDEEQRARLRSRILQFVARTHFEGAGGLVVSDSMRVVIAAQAALMTLELSPDVLRRLRTVLIYPSAFANRQERRARGGVVAQGVVHRAGEAWLDGPVVLAWDAALSGASRPDDGRNLVYHELAHHLDMLDGQADGLPPAATGEEERGWRRVFEEHFERLGRDVAAGRRTLLDPYGASDPAELFAVATEVFFERPKDLRRVHPELHATLVALYLQDPAARS